MKNKGFTLIELLAVIVILAIIALIAVPIIINIINDSRQNADKRSIELYGKAVENAIAKAQLNKQTIPDGTYSKVNDTQVCLDGDTEKTCIKVDVNGTKPYSYRMTIIEGEIAEQRIQLKENGPIYIKTGNGAFEKEQESADKPDTSGQESTNDEVVSKPCEWTDSNSSGTINLSDVVTCGSESFYVMGNATDNTITMLAVKNITTDTTNPIQSDSAGTIIFSSTNYWGNETGFVFDMKGSNGNYLNDRTYPIVNAYESYLKTTLGVNSASATLMSIEQARNLGCSTDSYRCISAPSWVYSTNYWLGSASDMYNVRNIQSYNYIGGGFGSVNTYGVRPVITISTNEI